MNHYIHGSFEDADIMLLVVDRPSPDQAEKVLLRRLKELSIPTFLVINKVDLHTHALVNEIMASWQKQHDFTKIHKVSALNNTGIDELYESLLTHLPVGPKYYPSDPLTDRTERFFVSEMIREQIILLYREEIPYSCDVSVESFKEEADIIRIEALIFVNAKSQKPILIGKDGRAIKELGTEARKKMEDFFQKKVFLSLRVKVRENWRNNEQLLNRFGYDR